MALQEETILKAISAYFKQLGLPAMEPTFPASSEGIDIAHMFSYKFNPLKPKKITFPFISPFAKLAALFVEKAFLRTNLYLRQPFLSFKVDLSAVKKDVEAMGYSLPSPITFREIFVYSQDFEAIHLRNGKVARGGLRWSDRKDDFRTEVLGLVKTQNTKNTIIVPVGSKGGFVLKDAETLTKETYAGKGKLCYSQFLSGCLDITDNVIDGKVIHPEGVVCYDGEDPYFVVAADKGTATFSDVANTISTKYKFWLGDAFASGGSNGYDHKKMGITAKGGWVAVERHFMEMGRDVNKEEFTCVGIGDMSGDVFGNGLLRSQTTKLICAFNHMHIFVDPNPDAAKSFKERERLFGLPSSTWANYNKAYISKGGAIFSRADKECKLTPEIKERFGIAQDVLSPEELIKTVLKSKFDLLWNGGIGTYVKASFEENSAAGDKANDNLRIDGNELGALVVGEGGNLGFTQKGRIEFALNGGRINTDAIDNSAGVDCSDHEVNIKILLNQLVEKSITMEERNGIVKKMTDEVGQLVLRDNYLQTKALSMEQFLKLPATEYTSLIDTLTHSGQLDIANEKLPENDEILKRGSLTRPELAILLAYTKSMLYGEAIKADLLKDKAFEKYLIGYFPTLMQQNYLEEIRAHKLASEITSTVVVNHVVNYTGLTMLHEVMKQTGKTGIELVKKYLELEEKLGLKALYAEIEALDLAVPAAETYALLSAIRAFVKAALKGGTASAEVTGISAPKALEVASKIKALKL